MTVDLTPADIDFIIAALSNTPLTGKPADLQAALDRLATIVAKLQTALPAPAPVPTGDPYP